MNTAMHAFEATSITTNGVPIPLPVNFLIRGAPPNLIWPELSKDLIEVACAIFLADRVQPRSRDTLASRHISLRLPVRQPKAWKPVASHLERALSILSDDVFEIDFYHSRSGAGCFPPDDEMKLRTRPQTSKRNSERTSIQRVALFSGGLDSTVGAAYLARRRETTAYVTYYVKDIQRIQTLLNDTYKIYGKGEQPLHIQFYIKPKREFAAKLKEHSRRSRSFLFVSLAIAAAHAVNALEVSVCENGVIALNLPFVPAMIPTRHAHSAFLQTMECVARELFKNEFRVVNPFELRTKGEMTEFLRDHPRLALQSVSCWNQQWSGRGANYGKGHCGYCVPCLVRRVSLHTAGISIPKSHFDLDVRRLASLKHLTSEQSAKLRYYRALLSFTKKIKSCPSWRSFLRSFPDIISSEPTTKPKSPEAWFRSLFLMLKGFGCEVERTFFSESNHG